MTVTMLYAGVLALVFLALSIRVIQARGETKVYMGDGGNPLMIRRMRGQANFVEYVPLTLLLMALVEMHGAPRMLMHGLGTTLLAGRLLHCYTFAFSAHFPPGRFIGTLLTWSVLGVSAALAIWKATQAL